MLKIIISIFKSIFSVYRLYQKKSYSIVFYYPQHFNRNSDQNVYFKILIKTCKENNIDYLVLEEPDFNSKCKRNKKATLFDFYFIIILLLRKLYSKKYTYSEIDYKIGVLFSNLFLVRFNYDNLITISQSMISFFRGFNNYSNIYDLQHGIIHKNKKDYFYKNSADSKLINYNIKILLNGPSYREILLKSDKSNYFKSNTFVIGNTIPLERKHHKYFNNNVLVTLQFTRDHTVEQNIMFLDKLILFIENTEKNVIFYLKNHPRFNDEIDLSNLYKIDNVKLAPKCLDKCFSLCSLHLTEYSTSVFESSLLGIPTILLSSNKNFNYFENEFEYPIDYKKINDFISVENYQISSNIVKKWASSYYDKFNEKQFLKLFKYED